MLKCDTAERTSASKGKILVIEDDEPLRRLYCRILSQAGFVVSALPDGKNVADTVMKDDFDAVLSDIAMPSVDGISVLRIVRQHNPDLPVVLMTAGADLRSAMFAVEHGALRYLTKPISPAALRDIAEQAVQCHRMSEVKRQAFEMYGSVMKQRSRQDDLNQTFNRALVTIGMAYQPIVSWSRRNVFAYEALVRAEEPTLRRPDHLLVAAEQLGRVHELGRVIRERIARDVALFELREPVFVNLHPKDLDDEQLFSADAPLSKLAHAVVLEVTERASLETIVDLHEKLETLRRHGFRIAIDDLGAGYAGLSTFAQLKPEVVKMDMCLVRNINQEATKQSVMRSMTNLCKELGTLVIAEGIETVPEKKTVVELGCDLLQGYLFAKPASELRGLKIESLSDDGNQGNR